MRFSSGRARACRYKRNGEQRETPIFLSKIANKGAGLTEKQAERESERRWEKNGDIMYRVRAIRLLKTVVAKYE